MLSKTQRQLLVAAGRAAELSPDRITAMLSVAENREPTRAENPPSLLVNQATAARLISGSRFLVRRLVRDGKIRQVFLTPDCVRYCRAELEKLAAGE
jgi:hypothetical protein